MSLRRSIALALTLLAGCCPGARAADAHPPFFAFCMDTHDARKRGLAEQAEMLRELGYDGCGHLWLDQVEERLRTLDAAGLKLFQVYLRVDVARGATQPFDPRLKDVLPLLKGRGTQLALLMQGAARSDEALDPHAVELLRGLAELCKPYDVPIVLYPHTGDWLETVQDAVRVADKVDRPNVGVMFNLCHWLRVGRDRDYLPILKAARPRLMAVSINGADEFDDQPGWGRYVQPLGAGNFDSARFLRALRDSGYGGAIGLQCYGLPGDARDHLSRSISAWRTLQGAP